MSTYNATCQLLEPTTARSSSDALQAEHKETMHPARRCSLRQMSAGSEATVFGLASARAYRCRLQSKLRISAGWRLRAKLDGEDDWREYVIRRAARTAHWDLLVESA